MTPAGNGRPLEDLITDLVSGVLELAAPAGAPRPAPGLRPVSVEFDLPVETRLSATATSVVVRADLPQYRTRTAFDPPLGRLALRLVGEAL